MNGKRGRDFKRDAKNFFRFKFLRSHNDGSVAQPRGRFRYHNSKQINNHNSYDQYHEQNQPPSMQIAPQNGDEPIDIPTMRNQELNDIIEEHSWWINTDDAQEILKAVTDDISKIVKKFNQAFNVFPFGSFVTRLGFTSSDIDFFIDRPEDSTMTDAILLNRLKKTFNVSPNFERVVKIPSARIPLVKCVHKPSGKECDISFVNEIGIRNTYLMQLYISMNANVRPLTMFLKHLLKKYELYGVGKITTYMMFWFVVYYMQQRHLLPPVYAVRAAVPEPYVIRGWDCRVPDFFDANAEDDLSTLDHVRDFFVFYDEFAFLRNVIAPHVGCVIEVINFERLQLHPNHYGVYLDKVASASETTFSSSYINLQDPSEHCVNSTKQVTLESANKFRLFCNFFRHIFTNVVPGPQHSGTPLAQIVPATIPVHPADMCRQQVMINVNRTKLPADHQILKNFHKDCVRYVLHVLESFLQNKINCAIESWMSNGVTKITRSKRGTDLVTKTATVGNVYCTSRTAEWFGVVDATGNSTDGDAGGDGQVLTASFNVSVVNNDDVRVLVEGPNVFVKYMSRTLFQLVSYPHVFLLESAAADSEEEN